MLFTEYLSSECHGYQLKWWVDELLSLLKKKVNLEQLCLFAHLHVTSYTFAA